MGPVVTISALRKMKKMSQIELGRRAGISQADISYIERGIVVPKPEVLKKLADEFGISTDDVLSDYRDYVRRRHE